MAQERRIEDALLAEIRRRIARVSENQRDLARQYQILTHAATQLRVGRSAELVLAQVREESPELLADFCELQVRVVTSPPVRAVTRLAAPA
jgi:hypothetical protein